MKIMQVKPKNNSISQLVCFGKSIHNLFLEHLYCQRFVHSIKYFGKRKHGDRLYFHIVKTHKCFEHVLKTHQIFFFLINA